MSKKTVLAWLTLLSIPLVGCGEGSSPSLTVVGGDVPLASTSSSDTSTIQAYLIDPSSLAGSSARGHLDRSKNSLSLQQLSGTISADRTFVQLSGGGSLSLFYGSNQYVAAFSTQPVGSDPLVGVLGVPSDPATLPASGSASYLGIATVEIDDGNALFDLSGNSSVSVDFGKAIANIVLDNLSGTRSDGLSSPTAVSNVAVVDVSNTHISNGSFSGGSADFISNSGLLTAALSGSQVVYTSGGFFGPSGSEVGGVLIINDTAGTGTLLIQGSFLGK